jgi:hypothetical protein
LFAPHAGEQMSPAKAGAAGNIVGCLTTVRRMIKAALAIGANAPPEEQLAARRQWVAALTFSEKGSAGLLGSRLFNKDDLDVMAGAVAKYAERGFGRDDNAIGAMMSDALELQGRRGRVVSKTCANPTPPHPHATPMPPALTPPPTARTQVRAPLRQEPTATEAVQGVCPRPGARPQGHHQGAR